jgi:acyl carrier protein
MTDAEIQAALTLVLRDILDDPSIAPRFEDKERDLPGFGSGAKITFILAVEERFGVHLRSREVDALRTFGDWVALVKRRLPAE